MKHIKLYENYIKNKKLNVKKITLQEYFDRFPEDVKNNVYVLHELSCFEFNICSLETNNINFNKVVRLICSSNHLTSLKGIEKFKNLEWLECNNNQIESLKELSSLKKLTEIWCDNNPLKNLQGIEKLPKLQQIWANDTDIENIDGIEKSPSLITINILRAPLEFPVSKAIKDRFFKKYDEDQIEHFQEYDVQKRFLDLYPERVGELKEFGYHKDLVDDPEYAWIFDQEDNGFFGLK